jgi:hypothetical protein
MANKVGKGFRRNHKDPSSRTPHASCSPYPRSIFLKNNLEKTVTFWFLETLT